jgi:hypothetical protein
MSLPLLLTFMLNVTSTTLERKDIALASTPNKMRKALLFRYYDNVGSLSSFMISFAFYKTLAF